MKLTLLFLTFFNIKLRVLRAAQGLLLLLSCMPDIATMAQIPTHYFHGERFDIESGLNQNVIYDFRCDDHDLIWLITLGGLQVFDGLQFITMSHMVPANMSSARLSNIQHNTLFLVTSNVIYKIDIRDYVDTLMPSIVLPPETAFQKSCWLLFENDDALYVQHPNDSCYVIDKASFTIANVFRLPVIPKYYSWFPEVGLNSVKPGYLEFLGEDSTYYSYDLATKKIFPRWKFNEYKSLLKISWDTLLVADNQFLHILFNNQDIKIPIPEPYSDFSGEYLVALDNHRILAGLKSNPYEFDLRTLTWTSRYRKTGGDQLIDIKVRMMRKDHLGNLYISTFNRGFIKLYPRNAAFQYIGTQDDTKNFVKCLSVSDSANLVLAGTLQNGLLLFDTLGNLKEHYLRFPDGSDQKYISGIIQLSSTRYIIFGRGAYFLDVQNKKFNFQKIEPFNPSWPSYTQTVLENKSKQIVYVANYNGLLTINPLESPVIQHTGNHTIQKTPVVCPYNEGFMGSTRYEMIEFDQTFDSVLHHYALPDLSLSRCMLQYSNTELLLGTNIGLYLIEITDQAKVKRKIFDKLVYSILPGMDGQGCWFSSDYGLFHMDANFKLTNFSKESGLQENEFNTNSAYRSESGKLYFGGINGITSFYPQQVGITPDNISTSISEITVNNEIWARYLDPLTTGSYTFSYKQSDIGFELLARGKKSPRKYNYQYMVKEIHEGWIDLGNNPKINFQLRPGSYHFYYQALDRFDPNAVPLNAISFRISPPYYKTWWFISFLGFLASGAILYLIRLNKKRQALKMRYEFEAQQKIQTDRMRISRELHDNIGAQMATVKRHINFLVSSQHSLTPVQVVDKMKDLEGISTQINQELRDTIWATQHEQLAIADFITRLKNYVFQNLDPSGECRVQYIEKCKPDIILGPFLALNLHRICQEAINNAIKHAGATELKIAFDGDEHHFKVTLLDNGSGFNPEISHEGYGMKNIKHRAQQINAILTIKSSPGQGTCMEIAISNLDKPNTPLGIWKK